MSLRIKNLKITFDYLTAAFFCTAVILSGDGRYPIAVFSTILHEMGHAVVMLFFGDENIEVTVNLFNIVISDSKRGVRAYSQDIAVICAGPAVNFFLFVIFGALDFFSGIVFFRDVSVINGILCVFNLLPVESTDGGQLVSIFLGKFFSQRITQTVITVFTVIIFIPAAILGFCVLLDSGFNYTLLLAAMYFMFVLLKRFS